MDRRIWWATFHGVTKSQIGLSTHAGRKALTFSATTGWTYHKRAKLMHDLLETQEQTLCALLDPVSIV